VSEVDFVDGYRDGRDLDCPVPSVNRSHSYRHSFAVGRAERMGRPITARLSRSHAAAAQEANAKQ
jgi:hypothetical protein